MRSEGESGAAASAATCPTCRAPAGDRRAVGASAARRPGRSPRSTRGCLCCSRCTCCTGSTCPPRRRRTCCARPRTSLRGPVNIIALLRTMCLRHSQSYLHSSCVSTLNCALADDCAGQCHVISGRREPLQFGLL